MKKILDWQKKEVVNIFDEVTIWSAPFGRLLLENIPMKTNSNIVDIGFGTGFPLLELSQRFGEKSKIYGIDIWGEAIELVKNKIEVLEINNIEILEESATRINLEDEQIDLVTSNLGINNFEDKEKVYREVFRILKPGGRLCITTNPIGTFQAFFDIFRSSLIALEMDDKLEMFTEYINHRGTKQSIVEELEHSGFRFLKGISDSTSFRFVDAKALMNHSLIRIGFRESWEKLVDGKKKDDLFKHLIKEIDAIIHSKGEFKLTIPMLYLEFEKV